MERAAKRLLEVGGTEREIRHIVSKISKDPKIRYPGAYLAKAIEAGDAPVLLADARKDLAERDAWDESREAATRSAAAAAAARQDRINTQAAERANGVSKEPHDPERVSGLIADLRADLSAKARAKLESPRQRTLDAPGETLQSSDDNGQETT